MLWGLIGRYGIVYISLLIFLLVLVVFFFIVLRFFLMVFWCELLNVV